MNELKQMLRYKRPADSVTEQDFINRYILPLGVTVDKAGNLHKTVGENPNILFSCHTDTFHNNQGMQQVRFDGRYFTTKNASCLGADDCAGVWIMREMIKSGKEGLYIFHREEEIGGVGSRFIRDETPEVLTGIDYAIGLDRKGNNSVITHQWGRCCSDEFGKMLASQLNGYVLDTTGVFTDTANYIDIVSECTNLSVGYYNEHTSKESLDFSHLESLKDQMIKLDVSQLKNFRDQNEKNIDKDFYFGEDDFSNSDMENIVYDYPGAVADLLQEYGFTAGSLKSELNIHY